MPVIVIRPLASSTVAVRVLDPHVAFVAGADRRIVDRDLMAVDRPDEPQVPIFAGGTSTPFPEIRRRRDDQTCRARTRSAPRRPFRHVIYAPVLAAHERRDRRPMAGLRRLHPGKIDLMQALGPSISLTMPITTPFMFASRWSFESLQRARDFAACVEFGDVSAVVDGMRRVGNEIRAGETGAETFDLHLPPARRSGSPITGDACLDHLLVAILENRLRDRLASFSECTGLSTTISSRGSQEFRSSCMSWLTLSSLSSSVALTEIAFFFGAVPAVHGHRLDLIGRG